MMKKTILSIMMLAFIGLSTSYGQVGIGTENPQARLHVDGQQNNPASGTPTNLQQEDDFVVTNQGQVGIGTSSPTQKLDVKGTIKGSEELIIGTNWLGGGALSIKNNDATKNVATFTNSTNNYAAVITDDRFFGVNTENPTERLDVNGNLRLRGAFMPDNNAGTAGQILESRGANNTPRWINAPTTLASWLLIDVFDEVATSPVNISSSTTQDNIDLGLSLPVTVPANVQAKIEVSYSVPVGTTIASEDWKGYYGITFRKNGNELDNGSRKFTIPSSPSNPRAKMVTVSNTIVDNIPTSTTAQTYTYTLNGYVEPTNNTADVPFRFNMWTGDTTSDNFNWGRAQMLIKVYYFND